MVKSKPSATASQVTRSSAGSYPSSMDKLVDGSGRIPVKLDAYRGYSQEEIEAFFASRDYEMSAVFNPDGEMVYVATSWVPAGTGYSADALDRVVSKRSDDGKGYVNFHTHPTASGAEIRMFSPQDVKSYVEDVEASSRSNFMPKNLPNRFVVRSGDGGRFELRYAGGGRLPSSGFGRAYTMAVNRARRETGAEFNEYGLSHRIGQPEYDLFHEVMTTKVDDWLKKGSASYGFRYTSNWNGRRSFS